MFYDKNSKRKNVSCPHTVCMTREYYDTSSLARHLIARPHLCYHPNSLKSNGPTSSESNHCKACDESKNLVVFVCKLCTYSTSNLDYYAHHTTTRHNGIVELKPSPFKAVSEQTMHEINTLVTYYKEIGEEIKKYNPKCTRSNKNSILKITKNIRKTTKTKVIEKPVVDSLKEEIPLGFVSVQETPEIIKEELYQEDIYSQEEAMYLNQEQYIDLWMYVALDTQLVVDELYD